MGQRSRSESVIRVFQAFLAQRTWRQPDLARRVSVTSHALRGILSDLVDSGVPLERDEDSPTEVYWSVPRHWFPGGALFRNEDLEVLLQCLARVSEGEDRDRLMSVIASCLSLSEEHRDRLRNVILGSPSVDDERALPLIIEAATRKAVLRCRYYSESRGRESRRVLSVHCVSMGPPHRFVATCHQSSQLKWFRVDNVLDAELAPTESYQDTPQEAVDVMLRVSVDGFRGDGPVVELTFTVHGNDARWVAKNLLDGMKALDIADGIRVVAKTAAVFRVARYVVSLGGAARPETPALAEAVLELAKGASEQAMATLCPHVVPKNGRVLHDSEHEIGRS